MEYTRIKFIYLFTSLFTLIFTISGLQSCEMSPCKPIKYSGAEFDKKYLTGTTTQTTSEAQITMSKTNPNVHETTVVYQRVEGDASDKLEDLVPEDSPEAKETIHNGGTENKDDHHKSRRSSDLKFLGNNNLKVSHHVRKKDLSRDLDIPEKVGRKLSQEEIDWAQRNLFYVHDIYKPGVGPPPP